MSRPALRLVPPKRRRGRIDRPLTEAECEALQKAVQRAMTGFVARPTSNSEWRALIEQRPAVAQTEAYANGIRDGRALERADIVKRIQGE